MQLLTFWFTCWTSYSFLYEDVLVPTGGGHGARGSWVKCPSSFPSWTTRRCSRLEPWIPAGQDAHYQVLLWHWSEGHPFSWNMSGSVRLEFQKVSKQGHLRFGCWTTSVWKQVATKSTSVFMLIGRLVDSDTAVTFPSPVCLLTYCDVCHNSQTWIHQ